MAESVMLTKEPYVPTDADFQLKGNAQDILVDSNFASQSFWKEVIARFRKKKSAVFGLIFVLVITFFAFVGPSMNSYTYSGQDLSQKNLAPRIPLIEYTGFFDGHENIATTKGTKTVNLYFENKLPHHLLYLKISFFHLKLNKMISVSFDSAIILSIPLCLSTN